MERGYSNQEVSIQLPIDELVKLQKLAHSIRAYKQTIAALKSDASLANCINLLHAKREYRIANEQKCKESDVLKKLRGFTETAEAEYDSLAGFVA